MLDDYPSLVTGNDYFRTTVIFNRQPIEMLSEPLILGILTFQVLYSLVQWYFFRRREYLFYALYSVIMGVYFFLQYRVETHFLPVGNLRLPESVLNSTVVFIALYFYIGFGRLFVDAPSIVPGLDKWIRIVSRFMLVYAVFTAFWFISREVHFTERLIHLFISLSFFVFFLYVLIVILMTGTALAKYLVTGSIIVGTGAIGAMIFRLFEPQMHQPKLSSFFFLQIGVILELICLNIGLIYKSKKIFDSSLQSGQLINKQLAENEKQLLNLNAVRDEISHELKVELGDGLAGIKLLSDMVQQKMGDTPVQELKRISENSERLVQSMNEIVWSLNHLNDDLPGLISYIREYAMNFMDQFGFECNMSVPQHIPPVSISGETRRHIFLSVKEALHNVVKHSGATRVDIDCTITDTLQITIQDNGRGIDSDLSRIGGNGLRNMKKRMGYLKGRLEIISQNGVSILFEIPLSQTGG